MAIIRVAIILGSNFPGGNYLGGNLPGGNYPGGNRPGGNFPGGNLPSTERRCMIDIIISFSFCILFVHVSFILINQKNPWAWIKQEV